MPNIKKVTSVKELPDCVTIKLSTNNLWEFRLKGVYLGQFVSQEQALEHFSNEREDLERRTGIDLTLKTIEEVVIVDNVASLPDEPKEPSRLMKFVRKFF